MKVSALQETNINYSYLTLNSSYNNEIM